MAWKMTRSKAAPTIRQIETRPDSPGEPGMQPRDPCLPWRGKLCESWTVKKAECQRTDAFELWCWRRLLRVPWTARRSSQPRAPNSQRFANSPDPHHTRAARTPRGPSLPSPLTPSSLHSAPKIRKQAQQLGNMSPLQPHLSPALTQASSSSI